MSTEEYGAVLKQFLMDIKEEFRQPIIKALKGNNDPTQKQIDQAILRMMEEESSAVKSGMTLEEATFLGTDHLPNTQDRI